MREYCVGKAVWSFPEGGERLDQSCVETRSCKWRALEAWWGSRRGDYEREEALETHS